MTQLCDNSATITAMPRNGITTRLGVISTSHTLVDIYAAFVPPLLGVLEVRCALTPEQTAWLLGIGSISSGVSQPVSAWLSDRFDSRLFGALGLLASAVCISCIGLANNYGTLVTLYVIGMVGVGIFHPTGASTMGQLADSLPGRRRSVGVSIFFVAGMAGGVTGSLLSTRITSLPDGFTLLRYLMIPGIIGALALHLFIRRVPHKSTDYEFAKTDPGENHRRWFMMALLYVSGVMRFTVNMAMFYLFVRWTHSIIAAANPEMEDKVIAAEGSPIVGNLNAFLILGMAIGGLSAGALIRRGYEKWPMVLIPIVLSPAFALFPFAGIEMGYLLAVVCGAGFACMVPVTLSVAQRLLPHRTSLASSLMLGGAWALAFIGPRAAEYCLGTLEIGLGRTFFLTAVLVALSGLV